MRILRKKGYDSISASILSPTLEEVKNALKILRNNQACGWNFCEADNDKKCGDGDPATGTHKHYLVWRNTPGNVEKVERERKFFLCLRKTHFQFYLDKCVITSNESQVLPFLYNITQKL